MSERARPSTQSPVQLGEKYVATGLATAEDVAAYQRFAADPSCSAVYYATHRILARRGD